MFAVKTETMLASTAILLGACESQEEAARRAEDYLSLGVKEIHPGVLEGYLPESQLPDSLLLLPPPPHEGSLAWELDMSTADYYIRLEDEDRRDQATVDANLRFPDFLQTFSCLPDVDISEEGNPVLCVILRRVLTDAGLSTYRAKRHYQRERPFMVNGAPSCTPWDEKNLSTDGSYPSGHTAIGWAWALILTELFPDQANSILERGKEFGISRMAANVHWYSDVLSGRMMGAAVLARLHACEQFLIDMAVAREEIAVLIKDPLLTN